MSRLYVFTYMGSKLRMVDAIQSLSPTDVSQLYELCGGFGSYALNYNCLYTLTVYNELNPAVYNLMSVLKYQADEFTSRLGTLDIQSDTFEAIRDGLIQSNTPVDRALDFARLQVNSFNGMRLSYVAKDRSARWLDNISTRLSLVSEQLQHIQLHNRDCLDILEEQSSNIQAFILLDIPYELGERVTKGIYGEFDWDSSMHESLYTRLRGLDGTIACKVMLCTYQSDLYDQLLDTGYWRRVHLAQVFSPSGRARQARQEYVYINYETYSPLARYHFDLE